MEGKREWTESLGEYYKGHLVRRAIPEEVKGELEKHLRSDDKSTKARRARGILAELAGKKNTSEISLLHVKVPQLIETRLGPDSIVDKKIIGYAISLLSTNFDDFVYIATKDGGIELEVSKIRVEKTLNIYSPVSQSELKTAIPIIPTPEEAKVKEAQAAQSADDVKYGSCMAKSGCIIGLLGLSGLGFIAPLFAPEWWEILSDNGVETLFSVVCLLGCLLVIFGIHIVMGAKKP